MEFEILSRIAGYYKGAFLISELMAYNLRELLFWYDKMTREIVEDSILNERASKKKPPLSSQTLKRMVDKKLRDYEEVV